MGDSPLPTPPTLEDRITALETSHRQLQIEVGNNYTAQQADKTRLDDLDPKVAELVTAKEDFESRIASLEKADAALPAKIDDKVKALQDSVNTQMESHTALKQALADAGLVREPV